MDIIQCVAIDCGDPPTPGSNVQISVENTLFEGTVTYSCPSGYVDDGGQKSLTCLASGQWSASGQWLASAVDIIQCVAIDCGEPPASGSNVQIDVDNTLFEGSATYSCPSGYIDDGGQKFVTCLASGQWSGSAMDIIQCVVDCGDPPTPGKDAIIDQLIGGTVTYRCETGSRVSGQVSVTCLTSGQWSSSESDLLQCAG